MRKVLSVLLALTPALALAQAEVGSEFQVNTSTTAIQGTPAVSSYGDTGFVVVWDSTTSAGTDSSVQSMQGQIYSSNGQRVGDEFQVNTYTSSAQKNGAVSGDGAGGFVVAWDSYGSFDDMSNTGIRAQKYQPSGAPLGNEFQVNTLWTSAQSHVDLWHDGAGGLVAVWDSRSSEGSDSQNTSIQARRFGPGVTPIGNDFQVNTFTANYQNYPAVGGNGDDGFVVVWGSFGSAGTDSSYRSVQAQVFESDGLPVGSEFQVNETTSLNQFNAVAIEDGAGGFVVVWESNESTGNDTDGASIQARRYQSDGTAIGGEFQVNTYTTGYQRMPTVTPDGLGGFVVVWESDGSSGSDTDGLSIRGRRYGPGGTPAEPEFQVNTSTVGYQWRPAIGPEGAGGFVVAWQSAESAGGDTDSWSVQGQILSLVKIFGDGFESGDVTLWSGSVSK